MVRRVAVFAFGLVSYAVFLATFLYALAFVGGFLVPTQLDGAARMPFAPALAVDLGLLALFAAQHSVMARPAFKRAWTRIVPEPLERPIYVLASSLCLIALFVFWQPLGGVVWQLDSTLGRAIAYTLFAFGWGLVLVTTFLINHFDLFGLRQVWLHLLGRPYRRLHFVEPGPYKIVRHPLYVGWLFAFWSTPTMTASHLVFAIMTTAYILVAIQLEERDLVAEHGASYTSYRRRVPMLFPRSSRRPRSEETATA
ncbi:MAG TPA: isoprenylcysteine carboxylmethyltransferase family protein [Candidatus Polarisedimenticolaceae bacterium]|nr:isoprenylcysteine carboxylmethyltransferase family protein [Candidatus Polarisedimenticolaceae bacterium]